MQNIYFTYRQHFTNTNHKYDISYFNDEQYADYKAAGLTEMIDGDRFIPGDRITKEIVPGVLSLRKAGVMKYLDGLNVAELETSLNNVAQGFGIEILTTEAMVLWIKDNTDLTEVEPGKFEISKAYTNEMGEAVEAKYLIVD